MDIEEISGPRILNTVKLPVSREVPAPVEEKALASHIRQRVSPYEDLDRWDVRDRVTISSEARRRYRRMRSRRDKRPGH